MKPIAPSSNGLSSRPVSTFSTTSTSISAKDAQASRSRLYGNIESSIPGRTTSTTSVPTARKTLSRPTAAQTNPPLSTLPTTRPTHSNHGVVRATTAPTTIPTRTAPIPNSSRLAKPHQSVSRSVTASMNDNPASDLTTRQPLRTSTFPTTISAPATRIPRASTTPTTSSSSSSTTTHISTPRKSVQLSSRRIESIKHALLTPQPKQELSPEANELLSQLDRCETAYLNQQFLSIEQECIELQQELLKEFQSNVGGRDETTIAHFRTLLSHAEAQYQSSLATLRTQHDEYKTSLMDEGKEMKAGMEALKLSNEHKIVEFDHLLTDLDKNEELLTLATKKHDLQKVVNSIKSSIECNELRLKKLNLTSPQKASLASFGKEIRAVIAETTAVKQSKAELLQHQREYDEQTEQFIAAELYRRQLHNLLQEIRGSIRVLCRIRPFMSYDGETEYKTLRYEPEISQLRLLLKDKEHQYDFDTILGPNSTQSDVFEEVNGIVQSAIDGYNVCLFSYGQTGSGKSHTMTGDLQCKDKKGIIPRSVDLIFDKTLELSSQGWNFDISVSCCQIYQERILDLLGGKANSDQELKIVNDKINKRITVTDLQIHRVSSVKEVHAALITATTNRTVAKTSMNPESSRSHFVFTLHITMTNDRTREQRVGTLNLCDLAGSERVSSAKTTGEQFKETQKINLSLSTLNRVFLELAQQKEHIPFRESKLTDLLQYCLSGNGKTMMIVNLSPTAASAQETNGSLQLAKTVGSIQKGKTKITGPKSTTDVAKPIKRKEPCEYFPPITATSQEEISHDNKRTRVEEDNNKSVDDQQLCSLSQFSFNPAPFRPNRDASFSALELIEELRQILAELNDECNMLETLHTALSNGVCKIHQSMSDLEPIHPINISAVLDQTTSQTALKSFSAKFAKLKEQLKELREGIHYSTSELIRKGQRLQFDNIEMELKSHEQHIIALFQSATAQVEVVKDASLILSQIKTTLHDIFVQFNEVEDTFQQNYHSLNDEFNAEVQTLCSKYQIDLENSQKQVDKSGKNLKQKQEEYTDAYQLKITGPLTRIQEQFETVTKEFNGFKLIDEDLKEQVQKLVKEKTPINDYLTRQAQTLDQHKSELKTLKESSSSYDAMKLHERRVKLQKYKDHNEQLRVKIEQAGGASLLAKLSHPLVSSASSVSSQSSSNSHESNSTSITSSIYQDKDDEEPSEMNDNDTPGTVRSRVTIDAKAALKSSAPPPAAPPRSTLAIRPLAARTNQMNQQPSTTTTSNGRSIPTTTSIPRKTVSSTMQPSRDTLSRVPHKPGH